MLATKKLPRRNSINIPYNIQKMDHAQMRTVVSRIAKQNLPLSERRPHISSIKNKQPASNVLKYFDIDSDFTSQVLFLETDALLQIEEVYNHEDEMQPDIAADKVVQEFLTDEEYPFYVPEYLQGENFMSNVKEAMNAIMAIEGATGVAIVDWNSGLTLGTQGGGLNLELAAAGNTNVVRAKQKVMHELGLKDSIEDILITLSTQYHVIRPLESNPNLFIYVVMNRSQANLGMARYQLQSIERDLRV